MRKGTNQMNDKINLVNHLGAVTTFPIKMSAEDNIDGTCLMQTSRYYQSLAEVSEILKIDHVLEVDRQMLTSIISEMRSILKEIDDEKSNRVDLVYTKKVSVKTENMIDRLENYPLEDSSRRAKERLFSCLNTVKAFSDNCFVKQFI